MDQENTLLSSQIVIKTCCRLERNQLRIRHKQDWGRDFILYLLLAAVLPKSDAGSDVVKHTVWTSKTFRTRALCSARYMGHVIRTWTGVCSAALHM